jgi:hypothetical protein
MTIGPESTNPVSRFSRKRMQSLKALKDLLVEWALKMRTQKEFSAESLMRCLQKLKLVEIPNFKEIPKNSIMR